MGTKLDGKIAIVTGAGRGLGKSYALDLAREGARVVIADLGVGNDGSGKDKDPAHEVVEEIKSFGGEAVVAFGDVGSYTESGATIQKAIETFGDLNIVVSNAGYCRDRMIFSMSEEEFDSVINVHLKGHFNFISQACAYWRGRAKVGEPVYGRLINTASEAFLYAAVGQPNYSAAKAGIVQLTLVAAQAMIKYGVTSNAIAPRARTLMTSVAGSASMFDKPEEGFDYYHPDNVAPFVTYLASPDAARVSGYVFVVYGNQVTIMERPTPGTVFTSSNKERWTMDDLSATLTPYFAEHEPVADGFIVQPF
jgi:3-oxoacyl-[acyl-carrier protein] reductase